MRPRDDGQTCADHPCKEPFGGLIASVRLSHAIHSKAASACGDRGKPRAFARNAALISDSTRWRPIRDIIEIGRRLTDAKAIAGHGNWLPWSEKEFGCKQ
jgi:Protein of unknown function (DUF3102)